MRLHWTRLARRDRSFIYEYVAADSIDAASVLDDRIEQRVDTLAHFPETGRPGRLAGTRELSISGTSYIVIYRVIGETIWILRIFHTARSWPPPKQ